jgi:enolase
MTDAVVVSVRAWECLDSRGHPTVGVEVRLSDAATGRALAPTGASVGQFEVPDARDGGVRYQGLGVRNAVAQVNDVVSATIHGLSPAAAERRLSGPGNVTLPVSLALAKAAASSSDIPLWKHLAITDVAPTIPCPMINIFSGGRHASGGLGIQDHMAVPLNAASFAEAIETIWEVRMRARELLAGRQGALVANLVADEGGLASVGADEEAPLEMLSAAIEKTGHAVGIAIDVAASQLPPGLDVIDLIAGWRSRYPLVSVEDPLDDNDWDGWVAATRRLAGLQIVGDDLFASRSERIERGGTARAANAVLIKPNQIGSVSGARAALDSARRHGLATIISARSGDTEDESLADIAVGWSAGQIKIGSLTRSERLAKYNRLLQIEALDGIRYAGWLGPRAVE